MRSGVPNGIRILEPPGQGANTEDVARDSNGLAVVAPGVSAPCSPMFAHRTCTEPVTFTKHATIPPRFSEAQAVGAGGE